MGVVVSGGGVGVVAVLVDLIQTPDENQNGCVVYCNVMNTICISVHTGLM